MAWKKYNSLHDLISTLFAIAGLTSLTVGSLLLDRNGSFHKLLHIATVQEKSSVLGISLHSILTAFFLMLGFFLLTTAITGRTVYLTQERYSNL